MRRVLFTLLALLSTLSLMAQSTDVDERIGELISKMSLEEKFGQLNLLSNPMRSTGASTDEQVVLNTHAMIREGRAGNFLNVVGAEQTYQLQKIAVEESRLGIPLLFGLDVIHGLKTIFPIPLADAASFDREAMWKSAHYAAKESAACGVNWTYAPMLDVSRDPRWGRVMEGAGEDTYLASEAGLARIRGFQGDDLSDGQTIAACAKHFVGYGASIAGRDYAAVDVSKRSLYDIYLPPFKAAADAGVASFMSAFNTVNGEPASTSRWLLTEVLREEWGYQGFVVSDWNSVLETLHHGTSIDTLDAAYNGIRAGLDMDMCGRAYLKSADGVMARGGVSQEMIDAMVARVLRAKFDLGLFDDPYKYCSVEREQSEILTDEAMEASLDVARRSIVLLKNDQQTLPLSKNIASIAVIGPLADDKDAPIGNWRAEADYDAAVSLLEGIRSAVGSQVEVTYAKGCDLVVDSNRLFHSQLTINQSDKSGFAEAIATAQSADVVVVAVGETALMSGECRSYADISLKGVQAELIEALRECGKPIVMALFTGRPLVLTDVVDNVDAILNCWFLGSRSGDAIADVIFGDYNPSAKLPMTFPRHAGQVPICYSELNTGRPYTSYPESFSSRYRDVVNAPLFAFGYGLSYTTFDYESIELSAQRINMSQELTINVRVSNSGDRDGEEVVQLYVRDLHGKGISRPLKELKGFEKVEVKAGESTTVSFTLTPEQLSYYRLDEIYAPEAGYFEIYVGGSSDNLPLKAKFELID
ncbi:MAG: beta-glucosidase BglX [Rikenellaceae bacterium]